jgi:serine/threonine protein kinase
MQHLHSNDIVHGALTVRSVELRPMDLPGGVTLGACVGDWGLGQVKQVTDRDEDCKWMSAEQIETGEPSKAADIWSLGCVIRCALYAATAPWQGFAPLDAAELIRTGTAPRPPKVEGIEVPAPIRTATQDCWMRDPEVRKSAADIAALLNDWNTADDDEPMVSKPSAAFTPAPAKEVFTPAPSKPQIGEVFTPAPLRDEGPTPWLGKVWHYPDIQRPQAEALLKTQPAGSFVVRNSSQTGVHALTFIQLDGVIGHGLLYKENNQWSVEKKPPFHATLEALLRTHDGLVFDEEQQKVQKQKYAEMFGSKQQAAPAPAPAAAHVSADGAPPASDGIVVCGRCEAIPAEVDCAQCAMLFCRGCSVDLHSKGMFRMHALKTHANTLQPGTAAVAAPPPRQRPSESDYIGKSWYRPEWDRVTAEQVLGAMPSGAFALRPSSQQNRLALSHSKGKNAVGHAIIHIHNGENNRYGYSIEDRDITYPTLEQLLSGLSDMRFDLVPPLTGPNGAAPAVRSVSPPPVAKPAPLEKRQSAVTTGTTEFSPFLPRAVRKDESGRFEAPKFSALGQSQLQPQTAAALSSSVDVDERLQPQRQAPPPAAAAAAQSPPRSPNEANAMLPPDDDIEEEDGYQALPDEAALRSLHELPQPQPFGAPDEDGYGVLPASNGDLQRTGYGVLPDDDEGTVNDQRFSEMTEYAHVELPNEDESGKLQQQRSRQSVRLSLSTMAALANDDAGYDAPPVGVPPSTPVPASPASAAAPAGTPAPGKPSKLCEACGQERAAKRVTMSDGSKVKLCNTCTEGIRLGNLVLTRDELTGNLVLSEPPSPLVSVVTGPGLTQAVVDRATQVVVIAHAADGARCEVGGSLVTARLSDPDGNERPLRVIDRNDGSYLIGFVCLAQGQHALHVGMQRTPTSPVQGVGKTPYAIAVSQPTTSTAGVCADCRRHPATAKFKQAGIVSFLCAPCTSARDRVAPGQAQITLLDPKHDVPPSPRSAAAAAAASSTATRAVQTANAAASLASSPPPSTALSMASTKSQPTGLKSGGQR